jgi:hypothetical protein
VKAALIPPKGYEFTALQSDIHLALPLPSTRNNPEYIRYLEAASRRGDYIILDNGCAEGQLVEPAELVDFAHQIEADEIVLPDVMDDMSETLAATMRFLEIYPQIGDGFNLMGVLQGTTKEEREKLLHKYYELDVRTIGIPKVQVQYQGSISRLETTLMIYRNYSPGTFAIHLLGLSAHYPAEMFHAKGVYGTSVRSMDSAQPYKATEKGFLMSPDKCWAPRRSDYFDREENEFDVLLDRNIAIFKRWAARA